MNKRYCYLLMKRMTEGIIRIITIQRQDLIGQIGSFKLLYQSFQYDLSYYIKIQHIITINHFIMMHVIL